MKEKQGKFCVFAYLFVSLFWRSEEPTPWSHNSISLRLKSDGQRSELRNGPCCSESTLRTSIRLRPLVLQTWLLGSGPKVKSQATVLWRQTRGLRQDPRAAPRPEGCGRAGGGGEHSRWGAIRGETGEILLFGCYLRIKTWKTAKKIAHLGKIVYFCGEINHHWQFKKKEW